MRRIGQLVAQPRAQKTRRMVEIDAALRQQPPDDFGHRQPLGDRLSVSPGSVNAAPDRRAIATQTPATPANRPFDTQQGASRAIHTGP